jgi:hypothetical protein
LLKATSKNPFFYHPADALDLLSATLSYSQVIRLGSKHNPLPTHTKAEDRRQKTEGTKRIKFLHIKVLLHQIKRPIKTSAFPKFLVCPGQFFTTLALLPSLQKRNILPL